jgi:uncharacterized ion transporter superfamily protein YfcC
LKCRGLWKAFIRYEVWLRMVEIKCGQFITDCFLVVYPSFLLKKKKKMLTNVTDSLASQDNLCSSSDYITKKKKKTCTKNILVSHKFKFMMIIWGSIPQDFVRNFYMHTWIHACVQISMYIFVNIDLYLHEYMYWTLNVLW